MFARILGREFSVTAIGNSVRQSSRRPENMMVSSKCRLQHVETDCMHYGVE